MKKLVGNLLILSLILVLLSACGREPAPVETPAPDPVMEEVEEMAEEEPMDEMAPHDEMTEEVSEYTIIPEESEARFIIGEILNGNDFDVVGVTTFVEGSISIDLADLGTLSMSPIRVDLSDLKTDSGFRDTAIKTVILESGKEEFRYGIFEATSFDGIPAEVEAGIPFEFTITGDLTLHGVTREVVFAATVTPISEDRLEGFASAEILYADFDIAILRLPPSVASVEENVILEIEFTAER